MNFLLDFNSSEYYSIENQLNPHYQQTDVSNMNAFQNNFNINSNWHQNYYSNDNNCHDFYYPNNIGIDNSNNYVCFIKFIYKVIWDREGF